jgi:hypothetical protein
MKRISITVSDDQYADLQEVAALDQTSIANVARDCIRATLPQLVQVSRFMYNPENSPQEVLAFADQMERALGMLSGAVKASEAASPQPATRKFRRPSPPSSNTGANSSQGG